MAHFSVTLSTSFVITVSKLSFPFSFSYTTQTMTFSVIPDVFWSSFTSQSQIQNGFTLFSRLGPSCLYAFIFSIRGSRCLIKFIHASTILTFSRHSDRVTNRCFTAICRSFCSNCFSSILQLCSIRDLTTLRSPYYGLKLDLCNFWLILSMAIHHKNP